MNDNSAPFSGTERFRVRRKLGSGAFGTVYEVHDRLQNAVVALKSLHDYEGHALLRFKQEFRALAELQHPNLVSLYELFSDGASWYFTMELVRGVDFIQHFRGTRASADSNSASETRSKVIVGTTEEPPGGESSVGGDGAVHKTLDVRRLRDGLRQLAQGVQALHDNGILHRDIKPSNILVTNENRVVLFDFGLASHAESVEERHHIVGTPAYISPEVLENKTASEASDWYSVGIVLHEVLTGRFPFPGNVEEMLRNKRFREPPSPRSLVPELPAELDRLCIELLRREPDRRPTGEDILNRLSELGPTAVISRRSTPSHSSSFVGRRMALDTLKEAYDAMRGGVTSLVRVHGTSGMGKTALVRSFLDSLARTAPETISLVGRCFERETVPYKAMDSLVDALSRYLSRLDGREVKRIVPEDMAAVAPLFPVLGKVGATSAPGRTISKGVDSQELRLRAFAGLRALFHRLATAHPTLLFIDDLQWGDLDSARLLAEILRGPGAPPLMLLGCYRSEEAQSSVFLKEALPLWSEKHAGQRSFEIEIRELPFEEARQLALGLMAESAASTSSELASHIAREASGNPFLIEQLVRHGGVDVSLEEVIQRRVHHLPEAAARILEVASVAAHPIDVAAAASAASIQGGLAGILTLLRNEHFIRTRETDTSDEIEPYHDRIRETIVAGLSEDSLKNHHFRLALTLERAGRSDPETLMEHFRRAGDAKAAARYAHQAARQAADALAFDRAARLYRTALNLHVGDEQTARGLRVELGRALAASGRGAEAAEAMLAAAAGAGPDEKIDLRRQAGEQYLISGRVAEGLRELRRVLDAVGMHLPKTPTRAMIWFVFWQAFLRVRGLWFREREERDVPPHLLKRLDVSHSVSRGLGLIDVLYGLEFQARHLALSLRAGEPYRISRALGYEASSAATSEWTQNRSRRLLELSTSLAERIGHPHALGLARLNTGLVSVLQARWGDARSQLEEARRVLQEGCIGVRHEFDIIDIFGMDCLFYLGELEAYFRRLPELLRESQARGDLYAEANLRLRVSNVECFACDDPDAAENQVRTAMAQWSQDGFHVQHTTELFRRVEIALYRNDPDAVWAWSEERWKEMSRSLILKVQVLRIIALDNHARLAVAMATKRDGDREAAAGFLRLADRNARRLSRESADWARAMANAIEAAIASARARPQEALVELGRAEELFGAAGMQMHRLVCCRRRGDLLGGQEGRELVASVDDQVRAQGVQKPSRWADCLLPGRWETRSVWR